VISEVLCTAKAEGRPESRPLLLRGSDALDVGMADAEVSFPAGVDQADVGQLFGDHGYRGCAADAVIPQPSLSAAEGAGAAGSAPGNGARSGATQPVLACWLLSVAGR
jgi:hypothetical protein